MSFLYLIATKIQLFFLKGKSIPWLFLIFLTASYNLGFVQSIYIQDSMLTSVNFAGPSLFVFLCPTIWLINIFLKNIFIYTTLSWFGLSICGYKCTSFHLIKLFSHLHISNVLHIPLLQELILIIPTVLFCSIIYIDQAE